MDNTYPSAVVHTSAITSAISTLDGAHTLAQRVKRVAIKAAGYGGGDPENGREVAQPSHALGRLKAHASHTNDAINEALDALAMLEEALSDGR